MPSQGRQKMSSHDQSQQEEVQGDLSQPIAESEPSEQRVSRQTSKPAGKANENLFSRPEIKSHLKSVVLVFAAIGVGYGGAGALVLSQLSDEQMMIIGGVVVPAAISVMFFMPTLIGAIVTLYADTRLAESGKDLYVITAASVFAGGIVYMVLATLILGFEVNTGLNLQGMLVPFIGAAIPAAAASAGITWAIDNEN